jgi:hypothetical protein
LALVVYQHLMDPEAATVAALVVGFLLLGGAIALARSMPSGGAAIPAGPSASGPGPVRPASSPPPAPPGPSA